MSTLSVFQRIAKSKTKIVSQIINHRTLIIVSVSTVIFLITFGVLAVKLRTYLLSKIASAQHTAQPAGPSDLSPATASGDLTRLILGNTGVTGTSSDAGAEPMIPTATPYPIVTLAPLPIVTLMPIPATTYTSSSSSCNGTPTVDNSQVYVSPGTTQVNSTSTISVELSDCNNTIAPVSDTLTVALVTGDYSTKINGASAPVTLQTQNGKVSFSVTSSNPTTATFLITDATRSFSVTTPGYHNPSVTFTGGSSGNSGNANCTTSAGAPNTWYSDVYPNPPITTTTGSVTLLAVIRDCFKNTTSVGDSLTISLASGDSGTKVNGNSLPYTVSAQNGQASFNVTSQVNGTVTLIVTDTTSGFTITDPNNHNPSITFSGSSTSTPTDTPTPTPTSAPADTPTPTTAATVTPTDTSTPTPTATGVPTPSPT